MDTNSQKNKVMSWLIGGILALSTTTLLYSLTPNPREGFDLHATDLLLPVLFGTAWRFSSLRRPHPAVIIFCIPLILSTFFSQNSLLTLYSSLKISGTFLLFSSLRHIKISFTPLIIVGVLSLIISLGLQFLIRDQPRAWGLTGQPNITAGIAGVLLLRSLDWKGWKRIGGGGIWLTTIILTFTRSIYPALFLALLPKLKGYVLLLLPLPLFAILFLPSAQRFLQNPFQDGRWIVGKEVLSQVRIIGAGFDTTTQEKETNPHNIYLQLLNELGIPLGIVAIGALLWHLKKLNPTVILILSMSVFDHFWLTTAQGYYLLGWALSQSSATQVQKEATQNKIPRQARIKSSNPRSPSRCPNTPSLKKRTIWHEDRPETWSTPRSELKLPGTD